MRVVVDEPVAAVRAAGLLVGEEDEGRVAGGLGAGAGEVPDVREDHRVHVLHVDRAATPDAAVALLGGEGVDLPVGGVGRDDVEVTVHREAGPRGVLALEAHDDGRAAGLALEQGASRPTSAKPAMTYSAALRSPGPDPSP